jgi:hypothetical protein
VEGAERLIVSSTTLQRKILRDDIDDVTTPTNLFENILRDMLSHDSSQ